MQGIYTYIPETNFVPREYSVTAILLLLFMMLISLVSVLNVLYFYISTYRSMCAMPNLAVFWSSLTSCFPCMLLAYFLNDFEMAPVAPFIAGVTFVFTFYMRCISNVSTLCFRIFSASFLIAFLSPEIATSLNIHVPFSLSRIIMSGLLLGIVLSVCICSSLTCFYWFWHMFIPVFFCPIVPLFPCICWSVVVHTLHHVCLCTVLLPVLGMLILCGLLSRQIVSKVCTCYLSLCSIFLSHNILFVVPGLVLLLLLLLLL